jgi:Lrp/AsnC family leucine-responsive transcriptional regulator
MDEIDLKLIQLLWEDPRRSYRDLADALSISTPAVHRRIQAAKEAEILLGPFVYISPTYLDAVPVMIFGQTKANSLDDVVKELKKGDSTYIVTIMSSNVLYLRGFLKSIDDLDKYVNFVRKAAQIAEPEIGIMPRENDMVCHDANREIKLTKLDLKIIRSLSKDGNKTAGDIAADINITPKTVRNHLNKLYDNKIIMFDLIASQAHSGNFVPMLQIYLKEDCEKKKVIHDILQRNKSAMLNTVTFSNHPNMMLGFGWLQNMAQLKDLISNLESEDSIKSVRPNIFINSVMLQTWINTLTDDTEKAIAFLKEINKM